MAVSEHAPAKINLFLHVGDRRADGYHPLQSLAVFTDAGDRLTFEDAPGLSLAVEGPFGVGLAGEADNLVLRAARALRNAVTGGDNAHITLTKNLPVASGIGGGSSDAAAALRGLKQLWNLPHEPPDMLRIAGDLGSDVPVCLAAAPSFMEGRGEVLRPIISLPRLSVLLVNPGVAVPTRDVFAGLQTRSGADMPLPAGRFADTGDLLRFLETTRNDLEAPATLLQPVIGAVLKAIAALPGALFTRMSGSGATCFGLFASDWSCSQAAEILAKACPGWWVQPTCVPAMGPVLEGMEHGEDIGPTPDEL